MELKRKDYFKTFTILGLAMSVLMGFQYVGAALYGLADIWVSNQEAGGFRWLSWLFHSSWTGLLVQYVFILGGAYPIVGLMVHWVPKAERKAYPLSLEDFMVCLVAAMGLGYIFNFIGTYINMYISMFTQKSVFEMNPAADIMSDLSPAMIIYACILGPFMEELMFRGILLKRARRFGDRTAVVFTAVSFGLMHGNISQFLYASVIGLVLGYAAVKTSSIRYSVIMHMMINSYGMILTAGEELLLDAGFTVGVTLYSLAFLASIGLFMVGALIVAWKYGPLWYRQLTWNNNGVSPYKKYAYLNPGFFLYLALCMVEMVFYLI